MGANSFLFLIAVLNNTLLAVSFQYLYPPKEYPIDNAACGRRPYNGVDIQFELFVVQL